MFVCKPCADKHSWPYLFDASEGPCEVCHKNAVCADIRTRLKETPMATPYEIKAQLAQACLAAVQGFLKSSAGQTMCGVGSAALEVQPNVIKVRYLTGAGPQYFLVRVSDT